MQGFLFRSIKQVLIRNLPQNVKPYRILDEFRKVGVIKDFKFPLDENDVTVGYILIEYSDPSLCEVAASKFNNARFSENYLKAIVIQEDPPNTKFSSKTFLPRTEYEENTTYELRSI